MSKSSITLTNPGKMLGTFQNGPVVKCSKISLYFTSDFEVK